MSIVLLFIWSVKHVLTVIWTLCSIKVTILETDTLKLQVSLLKEQLEQVSYLIPGYIIQPIINYRV